MKLALEIKMLKYYIYILFIYNVGALLLCHACLMWYDDYMLFILIQFQKCTLQ